MNGQQRLTGPDDETVIESEDYEDISDLQDTIDGELHSIFTEFGGDSNDVEFKINVYRTMPNQGDREYCFSCLPSELPIMDRIRDEYGAGSYEVWVYKNKRIFRRRKLNIAKRTYTPTPQPQQNNGADLRGLIESIAEQNRQQMELFMSMMRNNNPAPVQQQNFNPVDMITGMVSAMASLHGMMPKPADNTETFFRALEVMKDINSDSGEKNIWDAVSAALPALTDMGKAVAMQPAQGAPAGYGTPHINPQPGQPAQPAQPVQDEAMLKQMMLKNYLEQLIQQAARGADPALYADLIIDQMPEDQIKGFILQPDAMQQLAAIHPGVNQFAPWFEQLRSELQGILTDPIDSGTTGETDTGQAPPNEVRTPDNVTDNS